jgi:hypothetical protein
MKQFNCKSWFARMLIGWGEGEIGGAKVAIILLWWGRARFIRGKLLTLHWELSLPAINPANIPINPATLQLILCYVSIIRSYVAINPA